MNGQRKKTIALITTIGIAAISIFINAIVVPKYIELLKQNNSVVEQEVESKETIIEETIDKDQNIQPEENVEENDKSKDKEYIYKYIEGKEKQVIVEKEVEKTIEVPVSPTDAIVTYIDASGSTETINLPSGTAINFSAGEHGTYDTVPSSITLTDNQELDITDSSYSPSKVEVNYIFKGFSYSGDTMTCMYSLASNTVNTESKLIANSIIKNNVIYIKHEYIESTGTQYINTKYIPSFNTEVEITYAYTDISINYSPLFYSGNKFDSEDTFGIAYAKVANRSIAYYGNVNNVGCGERSVNRKYVETYNKTTSKLLDTVSGTTSNYSVNATSFTKGSRTLYLLTGNTTTTDLQGKTKAKIWSFKAKEGTDQKLDLIPVEKLDGSVGMLNLVNEEFLSVSGSGVFKHPDVILTSGVNAGKIMASGTYESGSTLALTAVANDGYIFAKWSDGNTNPERLVTVGDNKEYYALFVQE